MRVNEFGEKEVINLANGARMGYVADLCFDPCSGRIEALILPAKKDSPFAPCCEYEIPWCAIERIGEDYVFVRSLDAAHPSPKKRRFF